MSRISKAKKVTTSKANSVVTTFANIAPTKKPSSRLKIELHEGQWCRIWNGRSAIDALPHAGHWSRMLLWANSLNAGKFSFIFWLSDLGRNIAAKKKRLRVAGRGNVVHVAVTIITSSSNNQAPTMRDVVYRDTIWYELVQKSRPKRLEVSYSKRGILLATHFHRMKEGKWWNWSTSKTNLQVPYSR